jgi:hypothetical protein
LLYLSRYLYRGVIAESDILRCDTQGRVTFQYRDSKTGKMARRTLPGEDFLWLLLQHVLPKGLRRSRNFGFLHPNSAGALRLLQLLHVRAAPPASPAARPAWRCACGQPMAVLRRRMPALKCDGTAMHPRASGVGAEVVSAEVVSADNAKTQRHAPPDKPAAAMRPTMH